MEEPKNPAEREPLRMETIETIQQSPLAIIVLDLDYVRQIVIPALFKQRFTVDGSLDYDLTFLYRKAADEKSEKAARGSDDAHSPSGDLAIKRVPRLELRRTQPRNALASSHQPSGRLVRRSRGPGPRA